MQPVGNCKQKCYMCVLNFVANIFKVNNKNIIGTAVGVTVAPLLLVYDVIHLLYYVFLVMSIIN